MSTYKDIKSSRRLVWAGVIVGFAIALGIAISNLTSEDGNALSALAFLAVFSMPPSMAVLSLDRRPALLTVAAMATVVQGVLMFTSVGLLELVPAILWYMAGQRRPRDPVPPKGSDWLRPLLAAASIVPLLAMVTHLDPICVVTDADDEVVRVYEYEEAPTGWSLQLGASSTTSGSDGQTTTCTTNDLVGWEAGSSLVLSVGFVALVWVRWPTADQLTRENVSSDRPA